MSVQIIFLITIATIIFFKDVVKERKSLKIILERVTWVERHQILITNVTVVQLEAES
jgi:hypothetical protein